MLIVKGVEDSMIKSLKFLSLAGLTLGLAVLFNLGNANAASAACVDNLYRKGSSGTCVRYMQTLNNAYAPTYVKAVSTDGIFGWRTDSSVRSLQSFFGLQADGIVGPKTWKVLCTTQAGWRDSSGRSHMAIPAGWPLATAKSAGCSKHWAGTYVAGVLY